MIVAYTTSKWMQDMIFKQGNLETKYRYTNYRKEIFISKRQVIILTNLFLSLRGWFNFQSILQTTPYKNYTSWLDHHCELIHLWNNAELSLKSNLVPFIRLLIELPMNNIVDQLTNQSMQWPYNFNHHTILNFWHVKERKEKEKKGGIPDFALERRICKSFKEPFAFRILLDNVHFKAERLLGCLLIATKTISSSAAAVAAPSSLWPISYHMLMYLSICVCVCVCVSLSLSAYLSEGPSKRMNWQSNDQNSFH